MQNVKEIENNIFKAHLENKMILPDGSLCGTDGRMTRINNNVIVLGTSGGGKTRSVVIPNILAANESMIIADPKGCLYKEYHKYLESYGYRATRLNLIDPEQSDYYNPLSYVSTSDEIMRLAHMISYANVGTTAGESVRSADPFWDRASELLLSALIGYIIESVSIGTRNITKLNFRELISVMEKIDATEMEDLGTCELDKIMEKHSREYHLKNNELSWACRQWRKFRQTPEKTFNSILITTNAMLATLDTRGIQHLMCRDGMDMGHIGENPTAVFVEMSDTDRSKDLLANIFFSQAMSELCRYADAQPEHRLKRPVRFILDDFGTVCRIDNFERMISNIRSRNISAMIVLQSLSQLEAGYGASAHTIIDNCDTLLYMGGNDIDTAEYISRRSSRSLKSILAMPVGTHWQFRRGQPARLCETVDLNEYRYHEKQKQTTFMLFENTRKGAT